MSNQHPQILRLPEVKARTGMSRTFIYTAMSAGKFPAPRKLGARAIGWLSTEIDAWIMARCGDAL